MAQKEPTKIYIVTSGEYSDYGIAGVFLRREKAEAFVRFRNKTASSYEQTEIEEWEDSGLQVTRSGGLTPRYFVDVSDSGEIERSFLALGWLSLGGREEGPIRIRPGTTGYYIVAPTEAKARKIAKDKWAKEKALAEGI